MFIKKDEQKCRVLYGVTSQRFRRSPSSFSGIILQLCQNHYHAYIAEMGWGERLTPFGLKLGKCLNPLGRRLYYSSLENSGLGLK